MFVTCQAGFEALLARELKEVHGRAVAEQGPGWVRLEATTGAGQPAAALSGGISVTMKESPLAAGVLTDLAFAHLTLRDAVEVTGDAVNALASRTSEYFLGALRGERVEGEWPSVWQGPSELVGLGRRISAVEGAFGEQLKKKLARVAKLATPDLPRGTGVGPVRGLFVFFVDFKRAFVAREAFAHGSRRMADDPQAPSRSYLKVEEAYAVLGREPRGGETVCDLGAAPGGWSYSAAKRGAQVFAIDNGPLKGGALDHPAIEHRREDAFKFAPALVRLEAFDWLFCDMVEEPHEVLRRIVEPWLAQRWCRRFVVNLKFGRVDPVGLLQELRASGGAFAAAREVRVRHLFHDREEFTVVGSLE